MHLKTRNVNTAFRNLVGLFRSGKYECCEEHGPIIRSIVKRPSRNGSVLMIDEPVTITYEKPLERVLFNAARDANPFFHVYEALWMLAGRNDVAPLTNYASQMRTYSDDGGTLNGAYGYRWRKACRYEYTNGHTEIADAKEEVDQLDIIVNHLKADPTSRRAVLQMWNVEDDLLKIGLHPERSGNFYNPDLKLPASKDVCCNLSVMFSVRIDPFSMINGTVEREQHTLPAGAKFIDMTVTNRSNDMIWGMLGANYVHFTILQEYMAARLGAEVGRYHHFTNNLHVYDWNWKPEEWLNDLTRDDYSVGLPTNMVPLVKDPTTFEKEVHEVVNWYDGTRSIDVLLNEGPREHGWSEPFLEEVAARLFTAHALHKAKDDHGAFAVLAEIPADDWRIAAEGWMRRRLEKKGAK